MNEAEIEAALIQIGKMEEAAKNGYFSLLQVEMSELQNQLDKIKRRDHSKKEKLFKSNKPL